MDDKRPRPKRKAIPVRVKREVVERQKGVCPCGCGQAVSWKPKTGTKFDHRPPLRLRDVNEAWTDYIPPQHSADHIDAVCQEEHDRRTFRRGAGAATRSDSSEIARERKREKERAGEVKPKHKWPKGRKLQGRGFEKGSRPMRRR